jgi:asparagine synthase (glutamine-hydrolysing)
MKDTFIFGSEIKSFLPHPNFVKELNEEALKPYLTFQYSVLNETFFKKY